MSMNIKKRTHNESYSFAYCQDDKYPSRVFIAILTIDYIRGTFSMSTSGNFKEFTFVNQKQVNPMFDLMKSMAEFAVKKLKEEDIISRATGQEKS